MKIKKLHISIGFLVLILSLTVAGTLNQGFKPQNTLKIPKSSDGEITIITPENKTYTEPDSGYYPATYGFENDEDGITPQGWVDNSQAGCEGIVISDKLGHEKVLHLDDDSGNKLYFDNDFLNQTYGTIEMWVMSEDCTTGFGIRVQEYVSVEPVAHIHVGSNDKWTYYDGSILHNIAAFDGIYDPIDNTWYHLQIHFRANGAPSYKGLNQNKFKVVVDGLESEEIDFYNIKNNINRVTFSSGAAQTTDGWVDSVAYSWDLNYNIGDNFNEGLLLSYENSTTLDWQGYSLDGQTNKTILGNATIPMPDDGIHNIQVFGNDSMGAMYESELRYFTVNTAPPDITINSPTDSLIISSTAPSYDISIAGPYDSIWYALEGATNYTTTGLTGMIDQTAWSALSDGIITIDFFANNSARMEGTAQVMVIKDSSEEPPPVPPGIPGYNLIALIGVTLIVTILLAKRNNSFKTKTKEVMKN